MVCVLHSSQPSRFGRDTHDILASVLVTPEVWKVPTIIIQTFELLLGPFLRHSRRDIDTFVVSSFYLQETNTCAHRDLQLLCIYKQCKTCHLPFSTRQKRCLMFSQRTVGHSKFSFYLVHTGLNSTCGSSSTMEQEQWFPT